MTPGSQKLMFQYLLWLAGAFDKPKRKNLINNNTMEQDKNFTIRLKAAIDKRMTELGIWYMIIDGGVTGERYDELKRKFIDSFEQVTLNQLQGIKTPSPSPDLPFPYDLSKEPVNAIRTAILKHCSPEDMAALKEWLGTYQLPGAEQAQALDDNTYYDLSSLPQEDKERFATEVMASASNSLMRTFYSLGCKAHLDQMAVNDKNGDEFILAFRKVVNGKLLGPTLPQATPSGITWVRASERLPEISNKICNPRHVRIERKRRDGTLWIQKGVAYYFPERFKAVEWEDWDDYSPEDFPYTDLDNEGSVVWLKAGWYADIDCQKCEEHWSAPLNVIEWLDEAPSQGREVVAIAFAEWVDATAVRSGANEWTIGSGRDTKRYTTEELIPLFIKQTKHDL